MRKRRDSRNKGRSGEKAREEEKHQEEKYEETRNMGKSCLIK